jgi:hypothetical protein
MDPTPYCAGDSCIESEWEADSTCCKPVEGTADCCATCESSVSCAMMQFGGGCCSAWFEGGDKKKDFIVGRCEGAASGAEECWGEFGLCAVQPSTPSPTVTSQAPTVAPTTPLPTDAPTSAPTDEGEMLDGGAVATNFPSLAVTLSVASLVVSLVMGL